MKTKRADFYTMRAKGSPTWVAAPAAAQNALRVLEKTLARHALHHGVLFNRQACHYYIIGDF